MGLVMRNENWLDMELKNTIDLMCSDDWRARLKAEFLQNRIRLERLERAIECIKTNNTTGFSEELRLMLFQKNLMIALDDVLYCRANLHALNEYINDTSDMEA